MRQSAGLVVAVVLVAMSACAPRLVVAPVVSSPRFPDFVEPAVPPEMALSAAGVSQERAWRFLQAGDLRNAGREVAAALKATPKFFPAETTGGYIELARKDARSAMARFDRALASRADYAPALAGKGEALTLLDREGDALEAFQAALAADGRLVDLGRRVDVLRFQRVERDVSAARDAARSGRRDEALHAYRTAIERSPDTAFLYRELAVIEREDGQADQALADFRKAAALDPSDPSAWAQIGELLDARNDFDAALQAYARALALEPDSRVEARRDALKSRAEVSRLPAEYRAIGTLPQITRGDLAALIGVRLPALLTATRARDVGILTDIRGHWAERWMLSAARAGVLDAFANHTFQPRLVVRRVDLAQAVARLLAQIAVVAPTQARTWANARGRFPDMTPSHLAYPAASVATAAGVMTAAADGAFQPSRPVTGAEAVGALETLQALTSVQAGSAERPR